MNINTLGITDLFHLLESNKLVEVEETKKVFHDHFLCTKDNWLVNGLFDYYLSTNSVRAVEVLTGVREPHDKHLLDRLTEILSKPGNNQKIQALTLLGHIARKQPTWIYKLTNHALFRDLLKLLKVETDLLCIMSALYLLIMLLPMLPATLGPYLQEIFEVFSRLASYYHQQSLVISLPLSTSSIPSTIDKDQLFLLHLHVGLSSLFHRLYAMYPCNFISYLKQQYIQKDQLAIFTHAIRPLLDDVRMHPLLVTTSKDEEISAARWKKMEHHDIMAECERFTLDRSQEDVLIPSNARFSSFSDQPSTSSININRGITPVEISNGEDNTFWSPSIIISPHSPPLQSIVHDVRSTPSTPSNTRSGTSPPEAAVEATPETTPVKDLRKLSARQTTVAGSSAVRALNALGNGTLSGTSRPSTPTATSLSFIGNTGDGGINTNSGFISNRISKLMADRQIVLGQLKLSTTPRDNKRFSNSELSQNGKSESWPEDQEVLEIVSSPNSSKIETTKVIDPYFYVQNDAKMQGAITDISQNIYQFRLNCQRQGPVLKCDLNLQKKIRRVKSCPDIKINNAIEMTDGKRSEIKELEESGTQTCDLFPYEHLLLGVLDQKIQTSAQQSFQQKPSLKLSPTKMLDQYINACSRASIFSIDNNKIKTSISKQKQRKKNSEEEAEEETGDDHSDTDNASQLLQIMQMQLQFERQRREVHDERNRRLLGKLRDSRALEEHNHALTDRLRLFEKEIDELKADLENSKRQARQAEDKHAEGLRHWQNKCLEEQEQNRTLRNRTESLEVELKVEQSKAVECQRQTRAAEAALFEAAHQLKGALKAADRGKELERTLDIVQKKFLLFGEAHLKIQEKNEEHYDETKQQTVLLQKAYTEELNNMRRQLESRNSVLESLRAIINELENREIRKETQLVELQRLLRLTKERHEFELQSVESKYKAQVEINLFLEGRVLELHGMLETVTHPTNASTMNLTSSASPKERSPPLSVSLASSSEGSLAFIHSAAGIIMNDCCDTTSEIPNLQAIVEPAPSQSTSPTRANHQRRVSKQD
ncbi:hamartin [Prorops nasuta]|uniref:hamartin n=1 Tax=Prorops nasuta TaxID=863751 RepID=UPI0034CFFFBE